MGVEVTVTPSKAKKVIFTLLILVILGGAGFYLWKMGYVNTWLSKNPTPTEEQTTAPETATPETQKETTPEPPSTKEETETTETPAEEKPEQLPEVHDENIVLDIGNVEFETKTVKGRNNATTTKYKVGSVTLSITNGKTEPLALKGELVVLDSQGNNAVSSNFIYKTFEIPEIKPSETFNRKQPINTAGDVRPFLTGVTKGDPVTIQITLKDTNGNPVKTGKKDVTIE